MAESTTRREDREPTSEEGFLCPICYFPTGRLIRGKIYCGNCGFIES